MVVNPPALRASSSASLPTPPASLPVIMTINGNGRIIPAPAFILKVILAAIAAKPISRRYTSSTETRPGVWINTKKTRDLADHIDIALTISMLKHFKTHVYDIVHLPQNHSLKQQMPSPDFIFTEDNFFYLPQSRTPLKRQCTDNETISLGSLMSPLDFTGDFDMEYFMSVPNFLDHEPDANYIEQSLVW